MEENYQNNLEEQEISTNISNNDIDEGRYYSGDFFSFLAGEDESRNDTTEQIEEGSQEQVEDKESSEDKKEIIDNLEDLFNREFNSLEEATNYVRSLKDLLLKPDNPIAERYIENYIINRLAEEDAKVKGFAEHYLAFMNNPKEYILQYFPDKLAELGIQPVLSAEEIEKSIDKHLREEFGEDYKSRWDPNELLDVNSFTSKLLYRKNELYQHYMQINKKNEDILANWNKNLAEGRSNLETVRSNEQASVEDIASQYRDKFINEYGFTEEDYNKFINDMRDRVLTIEDMHKLVYFDGYMRLAYQRGLEDARKGVYKKLAAENQGEVVSAARRTQESASNVQLPDNLRNLLSGKLTIPYY